MDGGDFEEYGFEYEGGQNGYVKWISSSKPSWELTSAALEADPKAQISNRIFPAEPMCELQKKYLDRVPVLCHAQSPSELDVLTFYLRSSLLR